MPDPIVTRHILSSNDRRRLLAFIIDQAGGITELIQQLPPITPSPTTRAILTQAAVDAGYPRASAIEAIDTLITQNRLHDSPEVAVAP